MILSSGSRAKPHPRRYYDFRQQGQRENSDEESMRAADGHAPARIIGALPAGAEMASSLLTRIYQNARLFRPSPRE